MLLAPNELPINWKSVSIRQVLETIESGKRPKGGVRNISDGVPSVGGEHLTWDGGFDFSETRYVPVSFFESVQKGKVRVGDVLVVKDGATTGKTAFVNHTFPFSTAAVNEHVFVLRSRSDVCLEKFLFYALYSPSGQRQIKQSFHGAAQGGINQQFVDEVMIPLPRLSEQRRIVAKVEALFDRIREAKRLRTQAEEDGAVLFYAALEEVLDDAYANAPQIAPLGEFGTAFNGRASGSGQSAVRVFKTKHVYPFDLKQREPSFMKPDQISKCPTDRYLRKEDVLVCNIARGTLGRVCYVDHAENNWTVDTQIMILRTNSRCLGKWLFYYLYSRRGQKEILAREKGIAFADKRGQTYLYPRDVLTIPVPLPPIPRQAEVVSYLDRIYQRANALNERLTETDAEVKRLEQSILDRAFRGEL